MESRLTSKIVPLGKLLDDRLVAIRVLLDRHGIAALDEEELLAGVAFLDDVLSGRERAGLEHVGDLGALLGLQRGEDGHFGKEGLVESALARGVLIESAAVQTPREDQEPHVEKDGAERDAVESPEGAGRDGDDGRGTGSAITESARVAKDLIVRPAAYLCMSASSPKEDPSMQVATFLPSFGLSPFASSNTCPSFLTNTSSFPLSTT